MPYVINKTNGDTLLVLQDGTYDKTLSNSGGQGLNLVGKNYINYGELQQENFVRLLENFANDTQPTNALTGQLWYDTNTGTVKYYDGAKFRNISKAISGNTIPSSIDNVTSLLGDSWWDTNVDQLKIFNGSSWTTVGPAYTKNDGLSGAVVETVYDTVGNPNIVTKFYANTALIAIASASAEFTPNVAINGFATISPGFNLGLQVSNSKFVGTAVNSELLGNIASTNYLRNDVGGTISGSLTLANNLNLNNGTLILAVDSQNVIFKNTEYNKDILFVSNIDGVETQSITISGTTGNVSVIGDPVTELGVATKGYVDREVNSLSVLISSDIDNLQEQIDIALASNVTAIGESISELAESIADLTDIKADKIAPTLSTPILHNSVLTGTTQAPTPESGNESTAIATTEFVALSVNNILPIGAIIMWSGESSDIPYGWEICDGRVVSGRILPDLRDRFIVGAGAKYDVQETGGADEVTLNVSEIPNHGHTGSALSAGVHSHTGTATSAGLHSHNYTDSYYSEAWGPDKTLGNALAGSNHGNDYDNATWSATRETLQAGDHTHPVVTNSAGGHTHSVAIGTTGGSGSHENRPAFYAVYFIMKVV
jgi:microcystin-dependent protein